MTALEAHTSPLRDLTTKIPPATSRRVLSVLVPGENVAARIQRERMGPYLYEASALSTTIALHWEAGLSQHGFAVSQVVWVFTGVRGLLRLSHA
jgi:hypothetical protein